MKKDIKNEQVKRNKPLIEIPKKKISPEPKPKTFPTPKKLLKPGQQILND